MLYVRLATVEDAVTMSPNLRPADRAEIKASGVEIPSEALIECVRDSDMSFAVMHYSTPIALFGYQEETPTMAKVWMVATPVIESHSRQFIRECRRWVDYMNTKYRTLYNFYYEPNTLHRRWLEWCGFTVGSRHNVGINGEPFRIFHRNN